MAEPDISAVPGMEVSIPTIERELRRLWEADDANGKASLINFAVYSEMPGSLAHNDTLLAEITREHSCRALLINALLDAPQSNARAWISAHCRLTDGKKSVCSEQLAFQLDGKATGRIRNIVFAHLEGDLPLVFWWQGEFSRIFEPRLYRWMDRLILDSHDWKNPQAQIQILQSALESAPASLVVHDLEWSRTFGLRSAFATLFDRPRHTARLPDTTEIRIVHRPGHRFSALYLASWLSVTLGWKMTTTAFQMNPKKQGSLRIEETGDGQGAIESLQLLAGDAQFEVRREPQTPYYRTSVTVSNQTTHQFAPAEPETLAKLVSSQLGRGGSNTLFRKALPIFASLLKSGETEG